MSWRGWRIVRVRSYSANCASVDQFVGRLRKLQNGSPSSVNQRLSIASRTISSTTNNQSSGDDGYIGKPREPDEESSGPAQDKDVPQNEDKRMWRHWIEERLNQSGSGFQATGSSFSKSSQVKETAKKSAIPEEDGRMGKRSPALDSFFKSVLKSSSPSDPDHLEEPRTANFRNPFRQENVKSSFHPGEEHSEELRNNNPRNPFRRENLKSRFLTREDLAAEDSRDTNLGNLFHRENTKSSFFPGEEYKIAKNRNPSRDTGSDRNTNFTSRRGSFFQESATQPSRPYFPVRQVPSRLPEVSGDNLPVEALDEFEYRVLGSANEEDGVRDDDFLRELDEIGRSARGIRDEDYGNLATDEDEDWGDGKAQVLSDLALSNSEQFDLEDEENPYRIRPDRLFFPGQTYDPEDLDLSKVADPEKPTVRTRKKFPSQEVFQMADFRNPRFLSNFIRESSRILPKRHFQISAKAQRKVAREIKTARILGLMPFTSMGDPPFRFLRSWSEESTGSRFDDD